jgi:hypothetical protein
LSIGPNKHEQLRERYVSNVEVVHRKKSPTCWKGLF